MIQNSSILPALVCALLALACDSTDRAEQPNDVFRAGTDDDTTDESTDGGEPSPIPVGDNFGPCFSDADHVYHWCDTTPFPHTIICAVPQEDGLPHATVCVERRAKDACPSTQLLPIGGGLFGEYKIEQDFWNGCSLSCAAAADCPIGMICSSDVCSWETF
jgi:hypothetical protein